MTNLILTRKSSVLPAVAVLSIAGAPAHASTILLSDDFTNAVRVGSGPSSLTGVDRDGAGSLTHDWVMALNSNVNLSIQQGDTNAPKVVAGINGKSLAVSNTDSYGTNGDFQLVIPDPIPGFRYTFQHTGTLLPGNWPNVEARTATDTATLIFTYTPAPAETKRFFRVTRSLAP